MKRKNTVAFSLILVFFVAFGFVGCKKKASQQGVAGQGDGKSQAAAREELADYMDALAVMNKFWLAWQEQDSEAARIYMTRRLIRQHSDQQIVDYLAGSGNPHHVAFEVLEGKQIEPGRFEFKVRLFFKFTGRLDNRIETPVEQAVIIRDKRGKWMIDDLPIPAVSRTP